MRRGGGGSRDELMRICHVVYQYYPQNPRPRRAAETFARLGHELHVIAMRDVEQPLEEDVSGVHVHRFPLPVVRGGRARYLFQYLIFLLGSSAMLLRLHIRTRLDIVHVHSLPDFQVFCAIPEKAMGVRVVLDMHEAMPELFAARFHLLMTAWSVRIVQAAELTCCLFADHVLVVNETLRERITRRGLAEGKVSTVMNSPPPGSLVVTDLHARRQSLGLSDARAIVYVGGVNPERDLETLVRAVARLKSSNRLKLVIIGHGDQRYRDRIRELALHEGLADSFVGGQVPHDEAFSYISLSELGAITYQSNPLTELSMPTKALEYVAAGKPLVIANLQAVRRIFGDAALYYRPADPDDLARQLTRILEDTMLKHDLTQRAAGILAACDWNVMVERLASAYALPNERRP